MFITKALKADEMTQKTKQNNRLKTMLQRAAVFGMGLVLAAGLIRTPITAALSIQQQINQLQAENNQIDKKVDKLEDQATSYKDAIVKLASKINDLQGKINDNRETQVKLKKDIAKAQEELEQQRHLLGENIRAMYLEGQISTLEMLASSKDLSDFVDKEQYRNSVQDKIKTTLDKITELKHELTTKKEAIDKLLADLEEQQSELSDAKNKQDNLLSYNQSQQAAFNRKTSANQHKIAELVAQQQTAIDNIGVGGGLYFLRFPGSAHNFSPNNYPYKNWGFGMSPGGCTAAPCCGGSGGRR